MHKKKEIDPVGMAVKAFLAELAGLAMPEDPGKKIETNNSKPKT